ncbi:zinc finger protein 385B-like [Diachasmimorpha longicaudata]|uniref:zinc finger protein 385B-like n=1 Tax=Diachasmimorpha longicaudata TaxID=58733 RepID=UPI0030B892B6
MATPPEAVIDPPLNDPVTKAVVDNIMGNLPTKKPLVRCNDCDLCFTSQTVLDAHLQGARHAKQIRSKVIMASLEETKVAFTKDQEANGLKCNVCNVCLNSIQQLQTHLNGNRHKKKVMKGTWTETDEDEKSKDPPAPEVMPPPTPTKGALLSCNTCNKFFNSQAQYDVHIASKKHTHKISRSVPPKTKKKRFMPYKRKTKSNGNGPGQVHLSKNFVSGGYVYNS